MGERGPILAGVDLSSISPAVASLAVESARALGVGVALAHVIEPLFGGEENPPLIPPLKKMLSAARTEAESGLMALAAPCAAHTPNLKTFLLEGRTDREIIALADALFSPLIVMGGPHPHGPMAETLERVLRSAPVPVLVVRKAPEKRWEKVLVGIDPMDGEPFEMAGFLKELLPADAKFLVAGIFEKGVLEVF
ncbi:universal stress protein [bacterium]|nr:MAG: universal stress protein [bacterium]